MKNVIMIAYWFPPEGHAGVYRPLRFVRYLPMAGWQPTVITVEMYCERYDPYLLSLVPDGVQVIRVRNRDPWQAFQARRSRRMREKISKGGAEIETGIQSAHLMPLRSFIREMVRTLETWCYHPDITMGWIRPAVKALLKVCAHNRPDVIWATAGPVSSFVVAQRISHRTGVPYVLDFRDSWTITYNEFEERRPNWARRADKRAMFRLLKGAQAVIFRYDTEAECFWRVYQGALDPSRIHIIPNGYDGTIDKFTPSDADHCNILYTGTLSDYRYDTLLQAAQFLKQSSPHVAKKVRFRFIGEGTELLNRDAVALGVTDMITTSGPASQEVITRLSQESHALLMLGRPQTMRGYELIAGAKLFGYLKAGRPIIGVLPPDETKKSLLGVGVNTVADVNSVSEIVAVLRTLIDAWSEGTLSSLVPNRIACEIYSAERQTEDLVRALDGAPATKPFVPGSVEIPPSLKEKIRYRAHRPEDPELLMKT